MNDEIVAVGDFLGVVEQFLPGRGTYESDGRIYSTIVGRKKVDNAKLEVSVIPLKKKNTPMPKAGDTVIAEVTMCRKQSAGTHIFKVRNSFLFDTHNGTLHVSNMSRSYIRSVDDGFQPTDIIRARIMSKNFSEFELSTKGPDLGVIYAECVNCGTHLIKKGKLLECTLCGFPNPRKIANDYGRIRERIENL
ncbi:MAG: exosome complex RNA-binding protein Csl4 [Candidatus Hodarchaeota archaeon]